MKVTLGQCLVELGKIKKIILGLTILRNLKITNVTRRMRVTEIIRWRRQFYRFDRRQLVWHWGTRGELVGNTHLAAAEARASGGQQSQVTHTLRGPSFKIRF